MRWKLTGSSLLGLLGHKEGDRVYIKVNDDFGYYVVIRKVIKTEDEAEDHIRSF